MLARWVTKQISDHGIMPLEQRALAKGIWGCTHAHVVDQTACKDALYSNSSLAVGWIDFAKAFDSIPHGYIRYMLSVIKVHPRVRRLFSDMMRRWTVRYTVGTGSKRSESRALRVRCGVLQGDTLSPILFGLAVAPISQIDVSSDMRQPPPVNGRTPRGSPIYYIWMI